MNRYYQYDHMDLWQDDLWEERISRISGLVNYVGTVKKLSGNGYEKPGWDEKEEAAHYHSKTGSVDDPAVLDALLADGMTAHIRDMTEHWIAVVPTQMLGQRVERIPALMVCLQADYKDIYWAMKTLTEYEEYQRAARREKYMVIYVVSNNGPDLDRTYVNVLQEAAALFPVDTERIYMDISALAANGKRLSDIPAFSLPKADGEVCTDPDSQAILLWKSVPALLISGNWEHRGSLARDLVMSDKYSTADYDRERLLRSRTGKRLMNGIWMEYTCQDVNDERLRNWMEGKNVRLDIHESRGERWLTVAPKGALEQPEEKLPLFCVMQEVYRGNEHLAVTALGYFEPLIELAAEGECILLFFVMEDPEANDQLSELIDETVALYPADASRVYVTGHSHDGRYALLFAVRNLSKVAAVATLGNFMGLEDPSMLGDSKQVLSDEQVEWLSHQELPCVNLCGCKEHGGKLPLNVDAAELALRPGQEYGRIMRLDDRIVCWQRRLKAWNCPERTADEIVAVRNSDSRVERELGLPADREMVLFMDGFEHYIGDIRNRDGRYLLRMVGIENLPHVPSPSMLDLAWDFVRRFRRDPETGSIEELY
ncbi:MAG: hypothetical protein LIP11_12155 [Clostridiales bacterium]|nr:hypothetical protein [Clostridiales bacterium]